MKTFWIVLILLLNFMLAKGQQTVELCPGNRNTFTYYSSSNSVGSWLWRLGSDTISNNSSVTITWTEPGDFNIEVELNGLCSSPEENYIVHVIECAEAAIYFPNAFTPNNDRVNDRWGPKGIGIVEIEWRIFNRWGEEIYYATSMDDWWDGTYVKNKPIGDPFYYVQDDVYVYKANWKDVNGIEGQKIGHIVLIR